jgi:hypothetical protein
LDSPGGVSGKRQTLNEKISGLYIAKLKAEPPASSTSTWKAVTDVCNSPRTGGLSRNSVLGCWMKSLLVTVSFERRTFQATPTAQIKEV